MSFEYFWYDHSGKEVEKDCYEPGLIGLKEVVDIFNAKHIDYPEDLDNKDSNVICFVHSGGSIGRKKWEPKAKNSDIYIIFVSSAYPQISQSSEQHVYCLKYSVTDFVRTERAKTFFISCEEGKPNWNLIDSSGLDSSGLDSTSVDSSSVLKFKFLKSLYILCQGYKVANYDKFPIKGDESFNMRIRNVIISDEKKSETIMPSWWYPVFGEMLESSELDRELSYLKKYFQYANFDDKLDKIKKFVEKLKKSRYELKIFVDDSDENGNRELIQLFDDTLIGLETILKKI